jgi:iron complex transport system permease protein
MKRHLTGLILPLMAVLLTGCAGLVFGKAEIDWANWQQDIILSLRFTRVCGAFVIGAALAIAGMTLQGVLRNPLAEPFTLGISGGASVGAALTFILHIHTWGIYTIPVFALTGALTVLVLVLFFSRRLTTEDLLLSGVIAGTVSSSILVYLVSIADNSELAGVTWWLLGDLQAMDNRLLLFTAVILFAALFLIRCFAGELNALALGEERAWILGVSPRIFTVLFITTASLLASATVALAGLIAFTGLIVPHAVRRIYGCDHTRITLPVALWGGTFLMICDILSRIVHPVRELPVGVLTSLVGGTVFLYLIKVRRKGM